MTVKRKMGVDYGSVRIGVAISDMLGITARGIETINWNGKDDSWAIDRISALCKEHDVDTIVIGLPKRTDNKENENILIIKEFADKICAATGVKIIMRDERYTSVIANRIMNEVGMKKSRKRGVVDQIAAEIILQDFLNHCHER